MSIGYDEFRKQGHRVDMSRGKPSPEQLSLSAGLSSALSADDFRTADGIDCRNYGILEGIPEARSLGAELLDVAASQVLACGNSSLELMYDFLAGGMLFGMPGFRPWKEAPSVSVVCPVPGYDRHFAICEALGIRMINVPMNADGPDMDRVEAIVERDESVKGIWCVPLYSNPSGAIYSGDVIRRLASMRAAAPDFRLLWDDAYRFHHLTDEKFSTVNVVRACAEAGNEDRAVVFASLSKVTFAGAAMAFFASSKRNLDWWCERTRVRSIGPDKLNQLRHVRFLRDLKGIEQLMDRHREILAPKFDLVKTNFGNMFGERDDVRWTNPKGGYFIDLSTPAGCAARAVTLAADAGITLTAAGAAFPYGKDPDDRHIRIAPSYPTLAELEAATAGIVLSVLRAIDSRSAP